METPIKAAAQANDHPLRLALANEVHARPFLSLAAPERATHLAMTSGEQGAAGDHAHLTALCQRYGVAFPPPGANHFVAELDGYRLKWERHTEFCTWTFLKAGAFATPFAQNAIDFAPPDWVAAIPGARLVAVHVAVLARADDNPSPEPHPACKDVRGPDEAARMVEAMVRTRRISERLNIPR